MFVISFRCFPGWLVYLISGEIVRIGKLPFDNPTADAKLTGCLASRWLEFCLLPPRRS